MAENRHYSAFISYRHLDPDMFVAERLQKLLEEYRPPKGVGERDRIEYVFLDRAELPTSKSLNQSLKDALCNSDYLIVILSETYKESIWCMEEIRIFKELHGGKVDCILPVLVKGEPAESLPEEICYEEYKITDPDGSEKTVRRELEPLCCDVRGENHKEIERRLKTEFLRIAAPMLGCGYDDLYQRHRRQQKKRQAIVTGTAFAILTAILAVVLVSYYKVSVSQQQYRQSLLESYTRTGTDRSCASQSGEAMAYYAKVLRDDPSNRNARIGALLELQKQGWIVRVDGEDSKATPEVADAYTVDANETKTTVTMADGTAYVMDSPVTVNSRMAEMVYFNGNETYRPAVAPLKDEQEAGFAVYYGGYLYHYVPTGSAGADGAVRCEYREVIDLAAMFIENGNYNVELSANLYVSPSGALVGVRSGYAFAMVDAKKWIVRHDFETGPFEWKAVVFSPGEDRYAICRLVGTDFGNNGPFVEIRSMDGYLLGESDKDTKYGFVGCAFSSEGKTLMFARRNRISFLSGFNGNSVTGELLLDKPITAVRMMEDDSFQTYSADGEVRRYKVVVFAATGSAGVIPTDAHASETKQADDHFMDIDEAEREQLEETLGRQIIIKTPYPGGYAVVTTGSTIFLFHEGETTPYKTVEAEHNGMINRVAADGNGLLAAAVVTDDARSFLEIWEYDRGLHFTNVAGEAVGNDMKIGEDGSLTYWRYAPAYGADDERKWLLDAPEPDERVISMLEALTSCGLDDNMQTIIRDPSFAEDLGNWGSILEVK